MGIEKNGRDLEPLVVLLAERFAPAVRAGLAILPSGLLRTFEVETVETRNATRTYLAPVDAAGAPPTWVERAPAEYIAELEPTAREIAEVLTERLYRLDDEMELAVSGDVLHWRARGRGVCSLMRSDEKLIGVDSATSEKFELAGPSDVEALVASILEAHIRTLSETPADRSSAGVGRATAESSEPLLSAEELAAFRD